MNRPFRAAAAVVALLGAPAWPWPWQVPGQGPPPAASEPAAAAEAAAESAAEPEPPEPLPPPSEALAGLADLLDGARDEEAAERALELDGRLSAAGAAATGAWGEAERGLLAYAAGLAQARVALAELAAEVDSEEAAAVRLERADRLQAGALERFGRAAQAPGSDELRARALYAPGALLAARGERELVGALSTAMLQPSEVPFAEGTPERALLDGAVATLEDARAQLLVRLRHDWRDEDTRANLEWVARRLAEAERLRREADEEEARRQEQEQDEQDQQDQDRPEDGSDQDQADQQDGQDQQDQQQDQQQDEGTQDEQEGAPEEDREGEQEPPRPEDAEDRSSPDGEGTPEGVDEPQQVVEQGEPDERSAPPGEGAEPLPVGQEPLSEVEVRRLLQRLAEIEERGEQTRRALVSSQRRGVERDW